MLRSAVLQACRQTTFSFHQALSLMERLRSTYDRYHADYGVCTPALRRDYAPNTREMFRRRTMDQFVQAGIAILNPDEPDRPINSPNTRYQVSYLALQAIRAFGTEQWKVNLDHYLREHRALAERHESRRQLCG